MNRFTIIFIHLIFINSLFAQSKKEQIQILTFRVDSINTILSSERNTIFKDQNTKATTEISCIH